MTYLKLIILLLATITIFSCNSINEPESVDGVLKGNVVVDKGDDPNVDPWKELDGVLLLFFLEKYDEALPKLYRLVDKYKDHQVGMRALVCIEHILGATDKSDEILPMLERYAIGESKVAQFAHYRTGYRYLEIGKYDKAIEIMKGTEFDDEYYKAVRLYDLGVIYYSFLDNKEEAYKYFMELVTLYPNSSLADPAEVFYLRKLRQLFGPK